MPKRIREDRRNYRPFETALRIPESKQHRENVFKLLLNLNVDKFRNNDVLKPCNGDVVKPCTFYIV